MSDTLAHEETPMATTTSRGRISVDLRGLRPALEQMAQHSGMTPSAFTRRAVALALARNAAWTATAHGVSPRSHCIKVSLKLSRRHAAMLRDGARSAGMFPSPYVEALLDGVPDIAQSGRRPEALEALTRSNAELAAMGRNLNQLARALHRSHQAGATEAAAAVSDMAAVVREHLEVAATLLATLRPRCKPAASEEMA
jgi:hypothetical protein